MDLASEHYAAGRKKRDKERKAALGRTHWQRRSTRITGQSRVCKLPILSVRNRSHGKNERFRQFESKRLRSPVGRKARVTSPLSHIIFSGLIICTRYRITFTCCHCKTSLHKDRLPSVESLLIVAILRISFSCVTPRIALWGPGGPLSLIAWFGKRKQAYRAVWYCQSFSSRS